MGKFMGTHAEMENKQEEKQYRFKFLKERIKYLAVLYLALGIFTVFTGCSSQPVDTVGRIVPPQNNLIPVKGEWKITKCLNSDFTPLAPAEEKKWVGKTAQFSKDTFIIDDYAWSQPDYKIKRVNTEEYLLYRYKASPDEYGIKDKDMNIITVTSKDLYICELLMTDDGELITEIQNTILYMKKVSDTFTPAAKQSYINSDETYNSNGGELPGQSGVLLGLKEPQGSGDGDPIDYKYRTLWIAADDKKLHDVLETEGVFFPRKSGFWKLGVKRVGINNYTEDIVYAQNAAGQGNEKELNTLAVNNTVGIEGSLYRNIQYVCNDYISLESTGEEEISGKQLRNVDMLQIQPIDSLPIIKGIKISDIAGDAGTSAMQAGIESAMKTLPPGEVNEASLENQEENFGMYRKSGHWFFKGRLDYSIDGGLQHADYNINLIPPSKLVVYDDLCLTWAEIMDKVPEAVDAYTSPNQDLALVLTKSRLYIYGISNGKLGDSPLKKIALKKGETVIMAEWAEGSYVENWEKSFLKNQVEKIK